MLRKRPLALSLALFLLISFILSGFCSPAKLIIAVFSLILLAAAFLFAGKENEKTRFVRFAAPFILLPVTFSCFLSFSAFDAAYEKRCGRLEGAREIRAVIISKEQSFRTGARYSAYLTEADGENAGFRIKLYTPYYSDYTTGQAVSGVCDLTFDGTAPGIGERYDLSKGFLMYAECAAPLSPDGENVSVFPYTQIAKLRQRLSLALSVLTDDSGALSLAKALSFAGSSALSAPVKDSFSKLGISHLLAISGLHLGIIMASLRALLIFFKAKRRIADISMLVSGFAFVIITGFSPSVTRAYLMFFLLVISGFFGRKRDSVTSLLLAVGMICVISPYSIIDVGLHLSFFATLGILTCALPLIKKIKSFLKFRPAFYIISLEITTLSALLFTLPYYVFYFGSFPLIAPLTNLIFIPLMTLMIYLLPLVYLSALIPPLSAAAVSGFEFLSSAVISLSDMISGVTGGFSTDLSGTAVRALFIAAAAAAALCLILFKRKRIALIPVLCWALAVLITALAAGAGASEPELVCISSSGSDMLILKSEHRTALIDNSYAGYSFINSAIGKADAGTLSPVILIITHYHNSLIPTLDKLTDLGLISDIVLIAPEGDGAESDVAAAALELAKQKGAGCALIGSGTALDIGGVLLTVGTKGSSSHPAVYASIEFEGRSADGGDTVIYLSRGCEPPVAGEKLQGARIIAGSHGNKKEISEGSYEGAEVYEIENGLVFRKR